MKKSLSSLFFTTVLVASLAIPSVAEGETDNAQPPAEPASEAQPPTAEPSKPELATVLYKLTGGRHQYLATQGRVYAGNHPVTLQLYVLDATRYVAIYKLSKENADGTLTTIREKELHGAVQLQGTTIALRGLGKLQLPDAAEAEPVFRFASTIAKSDAIPLARTTSAWAPEAVKLAAKPVVATK